MHTAAHALRDIAELASLGAFLSWSPCRSRLAREARQDDRRRSPASIARPGDPGSATSAQACESRPN